MNFIGTLTLGPSMRTVQRSTAEMLFKRADNGDGLLTKEELRNELDRMNTGFTTEQGMFNADIQTLIDQFEGMSTPYFYSGFGPTQEDKNTLTLDELRHVAARDGNAEDITHMDVFQSEPESIPIFLPGKQTPKPAPQSPPAFLSQIMDLLQQLKQFFFS